MYSTFIRSVLLWSLLCTTLMASSQNDAPYRLRGMVLDSATRKPLAGASIAAAVRQWMNAADGSFSIELQKLPDTLIISFVGYRPLRFIVGLATVQQNLVLLMQPEENGLATVTVTTGMQELGKERSTGAFDLVSNEQINRGVSPDLLSRLEGMASSVLFSTTAGGSRDIDIRGISSLQNSISAPLIILDNFPYEGDVRNINPNDVQDVTILKDAAASSIWGARAGNGVIVIRTKQAGYQQPLRWQVSSQYTQTQEPRLFDHPVMAATDFIGTEKWLFDKGYYNSTLSNTTSRPVVSPVVELLNKNRNGQVSNEELAQRLAAYSQQDIRNDFLQYIYRPAQVWQNTFQLTVGGPQLSLLAGVGYDKQLSTLIGDESGRTTARLELNSKPLRWLQWGAGIIFTGTESNRSSDGGYNSISIGGGKTNFIYPYARLQNDSGQWLPYEKDYRQGYTDTAGGGLLYPWKYNPVLERDQRMNSTTGQHYLARLMLKLQMASWLQAELRWQQERSFSNTNQSWNEGAYFTRNLVNRFTQISNGQLTYNIPTGGIQHQRRDEMLSNNVRVQLNGQYRWQHWELNALAGAEARASETDGADWRNYGYDPGTLSVASVNYVTAFPQYGNLAGAAQVPNGNSLSGGNNRFVSGFANAGLSFQKQWLLNLSARRDASNILGVTTNQSGVPLWSAGLGWKLSSTPWWKSKQVETLGLRLTYGSSGNVDNSLSPLTTISYSSASGSIINQPYAGIRTPANAALRWEKVYQWNAGIVFSMLHRRISGSIDLYQKHSKDLLIPMDPDPTTGHTLLTLNAGELRVRGADLQLNTMLLDKKFRWSIDWLLQWNQSQILDYPKSPALGSVLVGNEKSINPQEGFPAYGVYSYRALPLDGSTGNPVGVLNNEASQNYISILSTTPASGLVFHGTSRPPFFGSVRNNFSWAGFTVSANIMMKWGHYLRNRSIHYNNLFASWAMHSDWYRRWQQPGDEANTTVPSMVYPNTSARDNFYTNSEVLVQKANYIRLQDVQVNWQLPPKWMKKVGMRNAQLYGLWQPGYYLYRASGNKVDPESADGVQQPASVSLGLRFGTQ
ncbi:MAG TPA: SusC/RagA family TonB-linked outer membrane protein [Phnomibacter sp.]|nr:SusC/RagA family TonB-linked outer membrane protein [Phnomibacter sp.]